MACTTPSRVMKACRKVCIVLASCMHLGARQQIQDPTFTVMFSCAGAGHYFSLYASYYYGTDLHTRENSATGPAPNPSKVLSQLQLTPEVRYLAASSLLHGRGA